MLRGATFEELCSLTLQEHDVAKVRVSTISTVLGLQKTHRQVTTDAISHLLFMPTTQYTVLAAGT